MKFQTTLGLTALVIGVFAIGYRLQAASFGDEVSPTASASVAEGPAMTVFKSPTCFCCARWVDDAKNAGFDLTVKNTNDMNRIKAEYGVPQTMMSCHTAVVDGVVIEGHVPMEDIRAYLTNGTYPLGDRTIGIAVPGMPQGSPGMETGRQDNFEVVAFAPRGHTKVLKRYEF